MSNTPKDGEERFLGEVTEVLSGAQYRVKLENGKEVIAHSCGKMRRKKIKIILSDKVIVAMQLQYDTNRGIIVERDGFRKKGPFTPSVKKNTNTSYGPPKKRR